MLDLGFGYLAVMAFDMSGRVTSMVAHLRVSEGPLQAVIWNVQQKAWQYNPKNAARFLYDDRYFDRGRRLERPEAEQVARDILHTDLPSDEELRRICAEGLTASEAQHESDERA